MNTEADYFSLFGLEPGFDLDLTQLKERYRALQREAHPDRFAHAGPQEQRRAVQQTARLNDALATLKSPLKRAVYLLFLKGVEVDHEASRTMDPAFLMEQMELRESLEQVRRSDDPDAVLADLERRVDADFKQQVDAFVSYYEQGDEAGLQQAAETVRKLQFLDKMRREIEIMEDQLTDD